MEEFIWDDSFKNNLRRDAHRYGEVAFLESVLKDGMRVIDCGAHCGVTAAAMATTVGKAGHVYAFEPIREYFSFLQKNIRRNSLANIAIFNLALSSQRGYLTFFKHGEGSGIAFVENAERKLVYATTITDFIKSHDTAIDFINLDCEGSELNVMRGTKGLLRKMKPGIFCEVHRDYLKTLSQSVEDIVGFLQKAGYAVIPVQVERPDMQSDFNECSHIYAKAKSD